MPKDLFEQMSTTGLASLALLLGFDALVHAPEAAGFRCNLREIRPLPEGFTIGDAKKAYLQHLGGADTRLLAELQRLVAHNEKVRDTDDHYCFNDVSTKALIEKLQGIVE